jgi:hypothetical protein
MRVANGEWTRTEDVALDLAAGEFRFRFDLPADAVEIAYSYPYPPSEAEKLFEDLRKHEGIEISYPGVTAKGRPFPHVVMRCTSPDITPLTIWALSREHAGEVSGAYTLDGFLRAAATSPLRECYEIHALPMVDLDAVTEGRYGKVAPPVDHHVSWTVDTPRPEITLAMNLISEISYQGKFARLLLNFHSPSPENDSYLAPYNPTLMTPAQRVGVERLYNAIATNSPAKFGFSVDHQAYQRVSAWYGDDVEHRADAFVLNAFGAESCLVETAYHASAAGTPSSPDQFRALGASVVRGVEAYLLGQSQGRIGLYDSMPSVYQHSHRWAIWRVPRFTRLTFTERSALAVADDPSAFAYFGMPYPMDLRDINTIQVTRGSGGTAFVHWLCYDERRVRFMHGPAPQVIPEGVQTLAVPQDLPRGTQYLRPSFWLEGAFRPFKVEMKDLRLRT